MALSKLPNVGQLTRSEFKVMRSLLLLFVPLRIRGVAIARRRHRSTLSSHGWKIQQERSQV
ncbi:hypothetical protein SD81_005115 [Tolypothrix campylonemoides VB511288]|nr:hypothetical protein SD81_005115 [Tolypothrix campylonemoides VB511288]